ncbi:DUF4400 domain-containing protein [Shewanella sp. UCD-KL12]|uniref:DUF4400 domain-containing protein n=1 Tax=Shewanella sp. UCD-KL12 TaxID=1917163 RepID=UPI0009702D9D|nr:DUF4400 domain-containing protein [Shewanella sp. UCD-KL12]
MSELVYEHGVTKLISLLLLIFTASLLVILTAVPSSIFQREVENEVKSLSKLINVTQWIEVTDKVNVNYSEKYIETGMQSAVEETLLPSGNYKIKKIIENFKGDFVLNRVVNNLHILAYQLTYRISILSFWFLLLIPYFIAVIYDGYTQRRIRLYEPKQVSIKGSRVWTRSIVYIIVLAFSYLVIPNFLGVTFAAWFPLLMLMLVGYACKKTIENYMKVA